MDRVFFHRVKEDQEEAFRKMVAEKTWGAVKLVGVTDFDRYLKLIEGEKV